MHACVEVAQGMCQLCAILCATKTQLFHILIYIGTWHIDIIIIREREMNRATRDTIIRFYRVIESRRATCAACASGCGMAKLSPRKPDPIFEPTLADDVNSARVQSAVWRYDQKRASVEREWGTDRLPYLVGDDMRAKWWRAIAALEAAIRLNDPDKVTPLVDNLVDPGKGFDKLIEEAIRAGHAKLDARVMETALPSGAVLCIVQGWPEHAHRPDPRPNVQVFTIEEIARLIDTEFSLVQKTKALFPDAAVVAPRRNPVYLDDEIPF